MKQQPDVKIAPAKGRPMLSWVGKRPLAHVPAFPAQHIETFSVTGEAGPSNEVDWTGWPDRYPQGGLLFHGDNKEVLAHLLASGFRGKVKLIYIDPPFDSGADYVRKVNLRGVKGSAKIEGEVYSLGEQIQYTDIWANDTYLQFMYERLCLLRELLAEGGALFVHCDWRRSHSLRLLLDEVFGARQFRNELVVKRGRRKNLQSQFTEIDALGAEHDTIFVYAKSPATRFGLVKSEIRATDAKWKDFWRGNVNRPSMRYEVPQFAFPKPTRGQLLWKKDRGLRAAENYAAYLRSGESDLEQYWLRKKDQYRQDTGHPFEFVHWDGEHNIKYWIPPKTSGVIGTLWNDIEAYSYRHSYNTEKHPHLLRRIIEMASSPGDVVLDCFVGSGTTAAVAQRLGRRWIACDINKGAIQTTAKRLHGGIRRHVKRAQSAQHELDVGTAQLDGNVKPAQLSFTVWRVNDYDLQIQHNEAVELACEHIGIERSRTDGFFDGTLGKRLVKIVPFGHPLSPVDLEEVKRELEARPEEDRDIVMVCLGKELAADAWLEEWNQLRRVRGGAPNRIEAIELRSDPKYGKFIAHRPAEARVDIRREKKKIVVEVQDFISPSIVERLDVDVPLFRAKIPDWRSMVDCVMIDAAHDGAVFNVALSDVPEKRDDLVTGRYEMPAPKGKTTVAVKIIDMLGEEVVVTARV